MDTAKKTTAFMYLRVSTPKQQVDEQRSIIETFAADHHIEIIKQYGDYQKRDKAEKRRSFQAMLEDIQTSKPSMILVQRLDRFGTADPDELGYFLTVLKRQGVKLVTAIDGRECSKGDLENSVLNVVAACQSKQEQIDKAERVLTGKRAKAILGEWVGSKYVTYGFDVVCIGSNGQEKWRLVEDAWDDRIKYALNDDGIYEEVERYTNETIIDESGVMPDKVIRHRPRKDSSDRLFYSPSIRDERVETLRRICEMFSEGWKTNAIADRLNEEGIRPVYSDHWYAKFIDGLLENTVLIGKPAWNKKSRSRFRHIEKGRIVPTEEEMKEKLRVNSKEDWYQGDEPIFDPVIPTEMFDTLQQKLEKRRRTSPKRSPKSETLWLGGLFVCAETNRKLAGNSQGKHFRVNHPEHKDKKLYFAEAEYFVFEYLQRVGKRLDAMTEQSESRKLLEKLATDEWMTELKLDYIVMELEGYLSRNLSFGYNKVGDTEVILDEDDEGKPVITTDGDYVELYCQMTKDYLEQNRNEVHAMREERDLLATECIKIKAKMQSDFLYDRYMQRIDELSADIEAASSSVDYRAWLEEVQNEVELLRQKQEQVQATMERGDYVQKAEAIRNLIERIVCHWARVPTDDKRFKDGYRTICDQVDVYAVDGEIMTIESTSRWTSFYSIKLAFAA